jgi:exonuclease SbcC
VQLQRLRLVNFRQHADTELVVGLGITAIVGPNGSGKTTLLEAIAWAFYGNPAARGNRDSIRRLQAPARSQVRVEVDFALGSHEFRVGRGLYNAELYQDGQEAPIATGTQEVSARVTRLLGMTRDEFFNTYFTGQKELAVMGSLGPSERARFLSRVLGYDKLKLAQDRLRETRARRRAELAGLEQGMGDRGVLVTEMDEARARVNQAEGGVRAAEEKRDGAVELRETEGPAWTEMVELRESVLSLESELRVAERDVGEARRDFERLDKDLAEALDARTQLDAMAQELALVEPLSGELDRLEKEAQAAGRRRDLAGQAKQIAEQIASVQARLDDVGDTDRSIERAKDQLERARNELGEAEKGEEVARTSWIRDKQDAETKRQALRDQYRELQKHRAGIVKAGRDGACPTCARVLGDEFDAVLADIDQQLEQIEMDGKYFKQRVGQLAAEPGEVVEARHRAADASRSVEKAVEEVARCEDRSAERVKTDEELRRLAARESELKQTIAELPDAYDAERHDEVRTRLRALEPVRRKGVELTVQAERAESLVRDAELAEKRLSDIEARHGRLRKALEDMGFSEERFVEARQKYEAAEAMLRDAELELASVRGDMKAAELQLEQVERRLSDWEERASRVKTLKGDLRLHDELDRSLHELRLELNAAMRPEIAERASVFLSDLTDARYTELVLDEQYRTLVLEDGLPKSVISGGEEDVVNLVLRLAISQMVAERAGQPLSLLVLDEVFGSLDESRRDNVIELLRRLAGRFPQVVLITHIESIKDGVDRVLRVEFDPQRATAGVVDDAGVLVA